MTGKKIKGIYVRGNTFWLTHGSGKRRLQVSLETTDYAQAVAKAQEILNQPLLNTTEGFKPDLDDFADEQVKAGVWTKKSRKSKYSVLLMFGEDINWSPLPDITTAICQKWYDLQIKRIAIVTANSYVMNIKSFLNWAVGKNNIAKNPADGVKLVKVLKGARERFCSFEERDKLINGAPTDELRFILFCGFYAGFRKNEIVEARPDWFDLRLKHIHVKRTETFLAKDKEERTIPMAEEFYRFLKKFGLRDPFMIQPKVVHGKSDYRYNFRKPFEDSMASLHMEWVTPHVMRHTFASLLASQGCSLYKIAKWLGDSEKTTAEHYAHLMPNDPDIEMLTGAGDKRKTAAPKLKTP
jgi:integrase